MFLRYKISKTEDGDNQLDIRIRFEENNIPNSVKDNTDLLKDLYTVMLKINNEVVDKKPVTFDFNTTDNIVALTYKVTMSNTDAIRFNLEAFLQSDNESNYIKNTSLIEPIVVLPIKIDKLFIDLSYNIFGERIQCLATPNIEPDFMEMKDTTNDWVKLESNSFNVQKTRNKQYIQVRGKHGNKYSYSNVIKIY